jgi:DNA-binding transcriptional LysR family regulator
LLDRSVRPIRLTESGRILLDEARDILDRVERARERTRSAGKQRTLTVGVVSEAVAGFVAGLSTHIRDVLATRYPDISLRVRVLGITTPTAGLHTGQADIAITRLPFDTNGVATRRIGDEPLVAALRSDDPLAARREIEAGELRDRLWCQLPSDVDPLWRRYWLGNPGGPSDHGREYRAGPVVHSLAEYVQCVAWEGAVGILPSSVARLYPAAGVSYLPLSDKPVNQMVLAWPTSRTDTMFQDVVDEITSAFETPRVPGETIDTGQGCSGVLNRRR